VADVARLPVLEIVSGSHFVADLTLAYDEVVFDYLAEHPRTSGKPAATVDGRINPDS
jgi:hypothetical protein